MKRTIAILLAFTMLMSSCASILNAKYQKVDIVTHRGNKVYIDGVEPDKRQGKYLLKRDAQAKQVTVKQKGYKDQHITIMPVRKSPWYLLSYIPFGVLVVPPVLDVYDKSFDYDKKIVVGTAMTPHIAKRSNDMKEVRLNKIGVDIKTEGLKLRISYNYRAFRKDKSRAKFKNISEHDETRLENTIFTKILNNLLKKKGYIDTTNKVLKSSYLNNLYLDATIKTMNLNTVANDIGGSCSSPRQYLGQLLYVDLGIEWKVLDYYKKVVHTLKTVSTSGQFKSDKEGKAAFYKATSDAVENGFIELMSSQKMQALLKDKSQNKKEAQFDKIQIAKPVAYVANLNQAIKSSVTVKNNQGHGSGFVVSNTGHIVTNYHVVANKKKLVIVFNNEKQYEAKVLRTSKIYDLALLKIDAKGLLPFKISTDKNFEIAQDIYAVGTPGSEDLSQTVSKGIISGLRKGDGDIKLIQTDASINPGNSGGAIVTKQGVVLGVVSSKLKGFGIEGVAFGIPAYEIFDRLKVVIED